MWLFVCWLCNIGLIRQVKMSVWCRVWALHSLEIIDCFIKYKKRFCFSCTEGSCLTIWLVYDFTLIDRKQFLLKDPIGINCLPMNLNKIFGKACGSSWRPASNFSMNYKSSVFEKDLVLSLYFFPTLCKDHEMKEICLVVGAKKCMVSPESFSFTDKHTAASVNKIHRERVRHIW